MNLKKLIGLFTIGCFLQTIAAPALQAISVPLPGIVKPTPTFEELLIPSSMGLITSAKYFASQKTIINIQDLHCHPEVQRNISTILGKLDAKYRLKTVLLEGGYGAIDTSWLCNIKSGALKKDIIETMVDQGRLTGGEYYAVTANRPDILKGFEDKNTHQSNIQRLGTILGKKESFETTVKQLDKDLAFLQAKYCTTRNRKFNAIIERHRSGNLPTDKFYALLEKYVKKINANPDEYNNFLNISMADYGNIGGYLEIQRSKRSLDYKLISRQQQMLLGELRQKLSFNAYNNLLRITDNFSNTDMLYTGILSATRQYNIPLHTYPDLWKFLAYVDKGRNINPIQLIKEEKRLVEEIRTALAQDISELEVSFAADFYQYFRDYLFNRLASDDYQYFTERVGKFKQIWTKYTYVDHLQELEPEYALLDEYYKVNAERNQIFLQKIIEQSPAVKTSPVRNQALRTTDENIHAVVQSLDQSKDIIVVISGGFHTEGLEQLLSNHKISYLSITPRITQDTGSAHAVYQKLAKQQARVLSSVPATITAIHAGPTPLLKNNTNSARTFAQSLVDVDFKHSDALGLIVASSQPGMGQLSIIAAALIQKVIDANKGAHQDSLITTIVNDLNALDGNRGRIRQRDNQIIFSAGEDEQEIGIDIDNGDSLPEHKTLSIDTQEIIAVVNRFSSWVFDQPQAVNKMFPALIAAMLWLAEQNILTGNGPVLQPQGQTIVNQIVYDYATDPETFAKLPDSVQRAIVNVYRQPQTAVFSGRELLKAAFHITSAGEPSRARGLSEPVISGYLDMPKPDNVNSESVDPLTVYGRRELASGVRVANIRFSSNDTFALGEVHYMDPNTVAFSVLSDERVRARDIIDQPLGPNAQDAGYTIWEWVKRSLFPGKVIAAFNLSQEHYWKKSTVTIVNGEVILKTGRGFWEFEKDQHPRGTFHIFSFDRDKRGTYDMTLDEDGQALEVPVQNGFAGPLLMKGGESQIGQIIIRPGQPCLDGDSVGWPSIDSHHLALTAYGYNEVGEIVIVQLAGDPNNPERPEPTLPDLIKVLEQLKIMDAVLGGTSGDVQRYHRDEKPQVLKSLGRTGSRFEESVGTPNGRKIGQALLVFKREAKYPIAFVTKNATGEQMEKLERTGFMPVMVKPVTAEQLQANPAIAVKNFGFGHRGWWAVTDEDGIVTLFVVAEGPQDTQDKIAELIETLTGNSKMGGSKPALRALFGGRAGSIDPRRAVVFGEAVGKKMPGGVAVLPMSAIGYGSGALTNVIHTQQKLNRLDAALEIELANAQIQQIERQDRLDGQSFGIAEDELVKLKARPGGVKGFLHSMIGKGARVQIRCTGNSMEVLLGMLKGTGIDGLIVTNENAVIDREKVANIIGNPELVIAQSGKRQRPLIDIKVTKDGITNANIYNAAAAVYRISIDKDAGENAGEKLGEFLRRLPDGSMVVFVAVDMKKVQLPRDMTQLNLFGVNVLSIFQTKERTVERERDFAYGLSMEEINENTSKWVESIPTLNRADREKAKQDVVLGAILYHLEELRGNDDLRSAFLDALFQRINGRIALASKNSQLRTGLADAELEQWYCSNIGAVTAPDPVVIDRFAKMAETMMQAELMGEVKAFVRAAKNPQAITIALQLIETFAESRANIQLRESDTTLLNMQGARKILEAA